MVFRLGFCFAALVAVAFLAAGGSDVSRGQSEVPTAPNSGKITVRGTIAGAHYVDIRSPIQGTILKVASEGPVKKGDLVVELDKTALESQVNSQTIVIARVQADWILTRPLSEAARLEWKARIAVAEGHLELAKLALNKYADSEHGEHKVAVDAAEREIVVAKKQLSLAEKRFARLKESAERESDALEKAELEVLKASAASDAAEARHKHLRTFDYEFRKRELELAVVTSQLELARARSASEAAMARQTVELNAKELALKNEREKLEKTQQQIQSCRIDSPLVGLVTLAKQQGRRGPVVIKPGSKVRERQGLLRIHDMDRLQLRVFVPAKQGKRIRVGAPAVVVIDAFPDRSFSGQVSRVSPNAESDSAFEKGVNDFSVMVSLNESPHGAVPGLTASAEIDVPNPE